ncbi:uncharacterized protein LOC107013421 [Solanum pennellii]|uniref:Uncharacterized protein LOC107013421 n=1 Tax=Solanum pennellii TaxID=28526 RepID=A0ABM1GBS1_SOLPN|nr:uncharacterized protein LOC107013421 [Solanum pennellii]
MGANEKEKAQLDTYQLKDVAQVWYKMLVDGRAIGEVPITWNILKTAFLERFFPRDQREAKVEDFINLCQGANSKEHDNMDLGRLMVHAQQVEESRRRKRGREGKNPRPSNQHGSSTGRSSFRVQDRPKFKKGHQHSSNPNPSGNTNAKGGKSGLNKGNDRNAQRDRKSCGKCGCLNGGEFFVGTNAFYGCDKSGHIIWDCQHVKNQTKVVTQPWSNPTAAAEPPKRKVLCFGM